MPVARRLRALVIAAPVAALVVACSGGDDEPELEPGTGAPTTLPSPSQTATSTSPTSPPPATPTSAQAPDGGARPDGGGGGLAALGATCTKDAQCQSGTCYLGSTSGYCSLACTQANAATVCKPPAFNGICNKQGFCRKP